MNYQQQNPRIQITTNFKKVKHKGSLQRWLSSGRQSRLNVKAAKMMFKMDRIQCDQIWPNFDTLAKFISICKVLGIVLVWNLANFCTYFLICNTTVQIFTDINGHRVKNNVAIWSHCMPPTLINFWKYSEPKRKRARKSE